MTAGDRRRAWVPLITLGLAVAAGLLVGLDPFFAVLAVAAIAVAAATFWNPMVGLVVLVASLVVGQLVRIPAFGAEGAMLPNDLFLPAFVAAWLLRGLLARRVELPSSPLSWPVATMALVFFLTFLAGSSQLPFLTDRERLTSVFYLVRWVEYALLIFVVADVVRTEQRARRLGLAFFGAALALALLGFVQLRLFPDFTSMVPKGWDPHVGRLLSTWFDPNFLGGFFAFVTTLAVGLTFFLRGRMRLVLGAFAGILTVALLLTYSRSSYAALLVGLIVLGLLRSRRLLIVIALVAVASFLAVPRVQERVSGALRIDETAQLRIVSWQHALEVVRDHPFTGIGYNTYRYVQVDYGFQRDAADHSAGGSDSSLLTILVTTGPAGLVAYLWIVWAAATIAWSSYRRGATALVRGLGLGALAALGSVVAHSFFINSLLFPHMMETIAIVFGTLIGLRAGAASERSIRVG